MALNANALVSLADTKDHLGIPALDTTQDARVERLINTASQLIEDHTDRKLTYQAYDVRRDGRRADRLVLPEWPVVAITSVWDDPGWDFQTQNIIDPTEYGIEEDCILVLKNGRKFQRANRNVRVTYTAGYRTLTGNTGDPIPSTLSYACLMVVDWLDALKADRRLGVTSKSKNGESISFTDTLPPQIATMLEEFVRQEIPLLDAPTGNA
jgi:uncharacterized phiE125 gp8 family phage protein